MKLQSLVSICVSALPVRSGNLPLAASFLMILTLAVTSCGPEASGNGSPDTLSNAVPEIETVSGSGEITLPLDKISDGKAHFYRYEHLGKQIKFFVLKSSDGTVRAAFDACDVCWRAGLGYYQEKDNMVCRNCGRRFASNRINDVQGGCNPAPLARKVTGKNLKIKASDIITGARYFNL